jgi:glyoxylase-like metal-dependent hydrolase (beta-lactamase superfamily II)
VHHDGKIILIDVGAGNDKSRPEQKVLDHLNNPFLAALKTAGVQPEEVDMVLLTHIHSDHVGWNTRLESGGWVLTFPNAVTVCSAREWRYGVALMDGDEAALENIRAEASLGIRVRNPISGTFADSMRPLEALGKVRLIEIDGSEVIPGIRYISSPGHSIDHASIELVSDGKVAVFGGDVLHHPVEVYDTDLVSCFCEFPENVPASRRKIMRRALDQSAVYFSSHFPQTSVGRIVQERGSFTWQPIDDPKLVD